MIKQYKKLSKFGDKLRKGKNIFKKTKPKKVVISKSSPKHKKIKSFQEYFEECIRNKKIPEDTPPYLRKALERAILEYNKKSPYLVDHDEYEKETVIKKEKSAFENFANKYTIEGIPGVTPKDYFGKIYKDLRDFFEKNKNIKFRVNLVTNMEKIHKDGKVQKDKSYFTSGNLINMKSTDTDSLIKKFMSSIYGGIDEYTKNGSEWRFESNDKLEIHTIGYNPTKGSSYIPLPDWITNKKAIVNIQNKDEKCFLWSVLRYLHPREKDEHRLTGLKEYEHSLNTKGITFPMKLKDINKFEKLNPDIPGINVFSVNENKKFYPLKMAQKDCINTIDLFLYEEDGVSHYSLITNFNRLIKTQKTSSKNGKIFICKKCFTHYTKEELLQKHILYCSNNETVSVKMPLSGEILKFKNHNKQIPIPFVAYADFECFTKPMNTCCPNPKDSYNYNYQKHEPSGFCIFIKGVVDKKIKPIIYSKTEEDEDIAKIFVEKLTEATRGIYNDFYRKPKPLILTQEEQKSFDKSEYCHICNKELLEDKVRDHCHFTGQYRGAAHNSCNLNCRKPLILPVIFHNLQGYDAHLFIKQLASLPGDLNCIPSTEEKYISFSKKIKVDEYRSKKTGQMVSLNFYRSV